MTYFADLSPYEYYANTPKARNVGWLSKDHPFPTGNTPAGLLDRLKRCCHNIGVNQTRGLHPCDFCDDPMAFWDNRDLGSAEIWAFGDNGVIYAAPTLIVHYIEVHRYLPPRGFIDAVLKGPMPPDPAYRERLTALDIDFNDHAELRARYTGEF